MKPFRLFALIILLFGGVLIVKGQTSNVIWSLEDCINYALENNLQVKKQSLYNEINEETLKQSKFERLPNLNASAGRSYNFGDKFDIYTSTYEQGTTVSDNYSLSSNVTLFNGFQISNNIKKNELELLASRYDLDYLMDNISLEIATAYLNILYNLETLDISLEQLEVSQEQVNRTKKLVDAGTLAKGSLLDIEAQAASDELEVVNAENNLELAYLTLAQLLDLDSYENLKIEIPDIQLAEDTELIFKVNDVFDYAVMNRPDIKSAEYRLESANKSIDLAKGGRYPSLTLGGYLTTRYSDQTFDSLGIVVPYGNQLDDNLYKNVGLSLSIPIFNALRTKTNISQAKLNAETYQYDLELAKNNLRKTIQQAYTDAKAALKTYFVTEKTVESLAEAFKYTEQKFNVGLVNSVDYKTAKTNLANAEAQLLLAKYDFVFKETILRFYMGKPLTLNQ